jgi:hypothetical protein
MVFGAASQVDLTTSWWGMISLPYLGYSESLKLRDHSKVSNFAQEVRGAGTIYG